MGSRDIRSFKILALQSRPYGSRYVDDPHGRICGTERNSLFAARPSDFGLVMPRLNGFELLTIVRKQFPLLPVIVVSGQYDASAPIGLMANALFTKGSYKHKELFAKIRELLERDPIRPSISG